MIPWCQGKDKCEHINSEFKTQEYVISKINFIIWTSRAMALVKSYTSIQKYSLFKQTTKMYFYYFKLFFFGGGYKINQNFDNYSKYMYMY